MDGWKVDGPFETPGSLSAEQSDKLRTFWSIVLRLFGCADVSKEWAAVFPKYVVEDDFADCLRVFDPPTTFRDEYYRLQRHDYADLLPLRFLKARLYEMDRSMRMLIMALAFRRREIPRAMRSETLADGRTPDPAFADVIRAQKSVVPCYASDGRTVTCIKLRNHQRGDCTLDAFERFILYAMEHAHLLHLPYQDRTVLLVDMTGFSVTAIDIAAIKFIINNFEMYYPEELYEGIIHNAPWLFSSVWSLIKPLLRQATRDKITFTSSIDDLAAKIGRQEAERCVGFKLEYVPKPDDEVFVDRTEPAQRADAPDGCKAAFAAWEENAVGVERLTEEWIELYREVPEPASEPKDKAASEGDAPAKTAEDLAAAKQDLDGRREAAMWKLSESYWAIDPYVRPKSYLDRQNLLPPSRDNALTLSAPTPSPTASGCGSGSGAALSRKSTNLSINSAGANSAGAGDRGPLSVPGTPNSAKPPSVLKKQASGLNLLRPNMKRVSSTASRGSNN